MNQEKRMKNKKDKVNKPSLRIYSGPSFIAGGEGGVVISECNPRKK